MMRTQTIPDYPSTHALDVYEPVPNVFYSLDAAVQLAGVSRRTFLVYCRANLVRPVFQQPYGVMEFTEEAIHTVRRIEHLRTLHRSDLAWINTVLNLLDEVGRIRSELRLFKND